MIDNGTRVKIIRGMDAGGQGRVADAFSIVRGITLNQPIYLVRLDEPNEIGSILTTAVEDEVEIIDRIESVGPFHCQILSHPVPKKRVIALGPAPEPVEVVEDELDFGDIKH